jgi:hypothetical protein
MTEMALSAEAAAGGAVRTTDLVATGREAGDRARGFLLSASAETDIRADRNRAMQAVLSMSIPF